MHYYLRIKHKLLRTFLSKYIPKFLDFTDYKLVKSQVNNLQKQVNYLQHRILFASEIDEWYKIIGELLVPKKNSISFKRIGSVFDGGYLLPDIENLPTDWVTIGLGYNFEFENQMVIDGCRVSSFDHTMKERPPGLSKKVTWHKIGWGSKYNETLPLDDLVSKTHIGNNWGLKFDIEGHEWELMHEILSLKNMPLIILCELHELNWDANRSVNDHKIDSLRNILKSFDLVSINGNNYSAEITTSLVTINEAVELVFVHKNFAFGLIDSNNFEKFSQLNISNNPNYKQSLFEVRKIK